MSVGFLGLGFSNNAAKPPHAAIGGRDGAKGEGEELKKNYYRGKGAVRSEESASGSYKAVGLKWRWRWNFGHFVFTMAAKLMILLQCFCTDDRSVSIDYCN